MRRAQVTLRELQSAIEASWRPETSNQPARWTRDNPALGQCAVTALVVQDFFDGDLLRTVVNGVSHYWNELPSGEEVDLTVHQFDHYVPDGREQRKRDYVLSFPDSLHRYMRLLELVTEYLEGQRGRGEELASSVQLEHP
jgi:hypothetical protein